MNKFNTFGDMPTNITSLDKTNRKLGHTVR